MSCVLYKSLSKEFRLLTSSWACKQDAVSEIGHIKPLLVIPRDSHHLFHAWVKKRRTQRFPVSCLGAGFISCIHSYDLDLCEAVITANKQRVDDGRRQKKKWKWPMFWNSVSKRKPYGDCLKTHLFLDIPRLQNLQWSEQKKNVTSSQQQLISSSYLILCWPASPVVTSSLGSMYSSSTTCRTGDT